MNLSETPTLELRRLRDVVGDVAREKIDAELAKREEPEKPKRRGRMNKTEALWHDRLVNDPKVIWTEFEAVKLRLADGSWVTLDFPVLYEDGHMEFHEVKGGHIREAAIVRFKVARERFPHWPIRMFQRTKSGIWKELYQQ